MRRREFVTLLGSAAVAWPGRSVGQVSSRRPLVAVLSTASLEAASTRLTAFGRRMQQLGHVAGQSIDIVYRSADDHFDRVPPLVDELLRLKPDVIVAGGTQVAIPVRRATATIPIVVPTAAVLVAAGLIESLARPGGNVTGILVYVDTLPGKQLALAAEIVPGVTSMGMLLGASNREARKGVEAAASALSIKLVPVEVSSSDELDAAFQTLVRERVGGVVVLQSAMFITERQRIASLASAARLPTMFGYREQVEAGGLMSYGVDLNVNWRRAAEFVDKILKGAKPADLPVELPTKFELVINVKTAKAIGLSILESFLVRADEVIE